ncbi:MAG: hypothetical protein H6511_06260 [Holophagales bacterium]|nr:hypothetical protein [Holophagales bacterium]
MTWKRFVPALLLAAAAVACSGRAPLPPPVAVASAPTAPEPEPPTPPPGLTGLEHLLDLPGQATTIHYSPGALDRAARVQERAELLASVFHKVDQRPMPMEIWVLEREDWTAAGLARPYGVPETVGEGWFALPAWGDPDQVRTMTRLLGGSPPVASSVPLRGTAEEAATLTVADEMFQLQAAADFGRRVGLVGDRPWVDGVLAHLVARIAFERFEPGRMLGIVSTFDRFTARFGGQASRRADDYQEGLPLESDLWYQAQFLRGADVLWVKEGENGSVRYLYKVIQRGTPLPAAELERAYPALTQWRATSFAP